MNHSLLGFYMVFARRVSLQMETFRSLALYGVAIGLLLLGFGNSGLKAQDSNPELRKAQRAFLDNIKPNLQRNCGDCHWGAGADAELDFEIYQTLDELLHASSKWKKVGSRVLDGTMPPQDAEPMPEQDKKELLDWLDQLFNSIDCTNINPGRVTIRRLNRDEYRRTIKSLWDVKYRPAESFPGDDVGYGFDNIADVLSLPPILMEKYLRAAEIITKKMIIDPDRPLVSHRVAGQDLKKQGGRGIQPYNGAMAMATNGVVSTSINALRPGQYRIEVTAYATQAGSEPAKMAFLVNGKGKREVSVRATEDEAKVYRYTARLEKGENEIGFGFTNDLYLPKKKQDRNLIIVNAKVQGPISLTDTHKAIFFVKPGETEQQQLEAASKIIRRQASLAFRRPASKDEVKRLTQLFKIARDDGSSFEGSIGYAMQAILVSPHFLFKVERPTPPNTTRTLSDYELATSLSYFLWSTTPDKKLLQSAYEGKLSDPKVYQAQIRRLLKHENSDALVENFAAQWLQLRALVDFEPDPDAFPGVDNVLRETMAMETKAVFREILKRNGTVLELLDTDFTYVNKRLAQHYGMDANMGRRLKRVQLNGKHRGGILTHASILTLTSNPTRTSPVKRGKWILENLLGEEPKFPDPDVVPLEDQTELTGTLRERMEQHRSNPACAACHLKMDALGFSLEHYDAVGKWREKDEGLPVDASAELPDGTQFNGADGLQQLFRSQMKEQFLRCFAEKVLIYALGRGLEYYDECTVDKILEYAKDNDYRIQSFFVAVANCDPFLKRRGILQVNEDENE